jgi:hypothetical protein
MQGFAFFGEAVIATARDVASSVLASDSCPEAEVVCGTVPLVGMIGGRAPAPAFVVNSAGQAVVIPRGAHGPVATRAPGVQYVGGAGGRGLDRRVSGVRIMDANRNQPRRVNYMNDQGQTVDPRTGRTISNSDPRGHLPYP